jgi:phage-related protein
VSDTGLTYKLFGVDVSASSALDKLGRHSKETGEAVQGHVSRLGGVGTAVAAGLGAAFGGVAVEGIAKLGESLVGGIKDAQDYQALAQQTAGVLKSTGDAANTSVPHVQALAGSLESLSGVDETQIINGQNVLATFTGIRNEAGKNNDVFDQATKAALNLSVAMGQDMKSSAVQVGKALNDPVKGITALSRVGVSFTAQQKDQITALVKSGDTMGAQKIILHELNKEFGNAAKSAGEGFGGSMARLQDIIGDTFRSIGLWLLPILTKLADWLTGTAVPAIIAFGQQIGPMLAPLLANAGQLIQTLAHWFMNSLVPAIQRLVAQVLPALKGLIGDVTQAFHDHKDVVDAVKVVFSALGTFITAVLWPILSALIVFLVSVLGPAFKILIAVLGIVIGVIKVIVIVVAAVITAFVKLGQGIAALVGWFKNAFGWIKNNWSSLLGILTSPFGAAIKWITDHWNGVLGFFRSMPGKIASIASGMWSGLWNSFRSVINSIIGGWNSLHFGVPSIDLGPLGHVGGFDFGVPQIPYLAKGGVVTKPTLAMIGEAGREAVIPLDKAGQLGETHYHFTFSGPFTGNQQDFVRAVQGAMKTVKAQGLS